MTGRLAGKVALITGAGSGMGREACVVFASEGARVAAVDVDAATLDGTATAVRDADGEIASFVADVADQDQVRAAVDGAVERFGGLQILYNNAGVLWRDRDVSVLETDEATWDRVFAINLKGMVWVCKYGVPHLIAGGGGAIVNVGSTSALLGDAIPQDAYTASKGAVISLTRNLAVQFGPQGVRANCIHPGFTDTPMVRALGEEFIMKNILPFTQLRRLIRPEEIADAICFMITNSAVSGELWADAGWHPSA